MKKLFLQLLILSASLQISGYSQDIINTSSLITGFEYSSQTTNLGSANDYERQPNLDASVNYFSRYHFDLGLQLKGIANADTSLSQIQGEADLSLGYTIYAGDKLAFYLSAMHSFYQGSMDTYLTTINNIFQIDASYTTDYYSPDLSINYVTGEKDRFFVVLNNYFNYDVEDFLAKNSILSLGFTAGIHIGDMNYYNDMVYNDWNREEILTWTAEYYSLRGAILLGELINRNGLEKAKSQFYEVLNENDPDLFRTNYTFTSATLGIPVYYGLGNWMFNIGISALIPVIQNDIFTQSTQFIFDAGISYFIDYE